MLTNKQALPAQYQRGFLLTRQAFDTKQGIVLSFWLKTENGAVNVIVEHELAVFFVEQSQHKQAQKLLVEQGISLDKVTQLSLKTFAQQSVSGFYFNTMRDSYQARQYLKEQGIKCYEDDFRPEERFLTERFITASMEFSYQDARQSYNSRERLNRKKYSHEFPIYHTNQCRPYVDEYFDDKGNRPVAGTNGISLDMVSLDIECSMQGELYSVGLYSKDKNGQALQCILMIGDQFKLQSNSNTISDHEGEKIEQSMVWLENEKALLIALIKWLTTHDPDVIIGWNVVNFDFRLLQQRCDLYKIDFAIGRNGKSPRWRTNLAQREQQFIEIAGRVVLDGIDLLKTATYSFPSFSLDNVANTLLGIGKKVDNVENRVAEITHNFHYDKLALAAYNLEDCRLVTLIFEHCHLLEFAMLRAQLTGLTLNRIGGSVAAFTNLYLPKLHRKGYVAPNMGDGLQGLVSPGGYVMDSIPGLYKNILVLDFKSLYPSIIRSFKIDPMGLIEGLKSPNESIVGFDGAYFSREQHFLPDMITALWSERDKAKKEKNAALSQAIKIIMNSFYGILGSTGCRFFDPRLSGSITKRSHEILKTTQAWIETKGYRVIYGDTDSIFVEAGAEKTLKESRLLGKELAVFINEAWHKNLKQRFNIACYLEIEFETHFSQFFMPAVRGQLLNKAILTTSDTQGSIGTKKRYVGQIEHDDKKEMVFKGLETVRSDWTSLAKEFQQSIYQQVFNHQSVKSLAVYIKDIVHKTLSGEFDDQLIYRKRLRRKPEDYVKTAPPHVKAARFSNEHNLRKGKEPKYSNKGWIEYVITINGPQTLEYQNAALDYQHYIDKQLKAVADDILPFLQTSFSQINDQQLSLF